MTEGSKKHYIGNTAQYSSAGLIIRPKEPKNLKAPFDRIDSYPTPTELFYIRSHFPTPHLDRTYYQSRIDGAVRRPFALSYEELRGMRSETRVAILECAGNSRVFLVPQVQGAQWELGAAGNAEWTGVLHEGQPDRLQRLQCSEFSITAMADPKKCVWRHMNCPLSISPAGPAASGFSNSRCRE